MNGAFEMSGLQPRLVLGPTTYEVSADVVGGVVVIPDGTTGKVKPAGAAAKNVLGVAMTNAHPRGSAPTSGPLDMSWDGPTTSVAHTGEFKLTFAGACAFGQLVQAAANGQVQAAPADATFDTIIGRCTDPVGATGAGSIARVRLSL